MLITPATMAPFIRFFRVIAEEAQSAAPGTAFRITAVATVAYWLCAMPGVVTHWIPYVARVRRTAGGHPASTAAHVAASSRARPWPVFRSRSCGTWFQPGRWGWFDKSSLATIGP